MSSRNTPTVTLHIYLLKSQYSAGADALQKANLTVDHIKGIGDLYTEARAPAAPRWLSFFDGALTKGGEIMTASSAGVLFVARGPRIFAVTFGYGRSMLVRSSWEEGFGLRVTLNSVDPKKLKSVDFKTFDVVTRHNRTQTSRDGSTEDFGIDIERDLVRAVTGEPFDGALGKRLTGMDALVAVAKVDRDGLPSLLDRYLKQYVSVAYQAHFPWIDNIAEVRDIGKKEELDAKLIARLRRGDTSRLWLSAPDIVDWTQVGGFKFRPHDEPQPDLQVSELLRTIDDPSTITLALLRRRSVQVVDSSDGITIDSWPVYRCVYCEEGDGAETFLLSTGKWYKIETSFVNAVDKAVRSLVDAQPRLPPYKIGDMDERGYNDRVASASGGVLALMDRKMIAHGGGRSQFELCDLYSNTQQMIAVKRYNGSSSPMSHLCHQALAVAQLWKSDADFRRKANRLLPRSHKLTDSAKTPDVSQFPIVFAIVGEAGKPIHEILPFFSRLALRSAGHQIRLLGYPVSVVKIDQE